MPLKGEANRAYQREWARANRAKQAAYSGNLKRRAVDVLGGRCVYCKCDDIKALEINHKHGGGTKAEAQIGRKTKGLYLAIIRGEGLDGLELTCRPCNAWHYLVQLKGLPDGWTITYSKEKAQSNGLMGS